VRHGRGAEGAVRGRERVCDAGSRAFFGFLDCALCKAPISHWSLEVESEAVENSLR